MVACDLSKKLDELKSNPETLLNLKEKRYFGIGANKQWLKYLIKMPIS